MNQPTIVEAIYENGVLKPTHPLDLKEKQVVQVSVNPKPSLPHSYISRRAEVCGGRPALDGTRIPVKVLVHHYRTSQNVEEILSGFPQLNLAQFYAALSYYYAHQAEIEADLEADELSELLTRFNLDIDVNGVMIPQK